MNDVRLEHWISALDAIQIIDISKRWARCWSMGSSLFLSTLLSFQNKCKYFVDNGIIVSVRIWIFGTKFQSVYLLPVSVRSWPETRFTFLDHWLKYAKANRRKTILYQIWLWKRIWKAIRTLPFPLLKKETISFTLLSTVIKKLLVPTGVESWKI